MASSHNFGQRSTAEEVAEAFAKDISGKNVLITGASITGIGFEFARVIAKYASLVIIAGRTQSKNDEAKARIVAGAPGGAQVRTLSLDLSSFASVRKAAAEVLTYTEPIHVLVNNAAIYPANYQKTSDGFELQFQTNHLAAFLFTSLIYPKVLAGGTPEVPARIVNISSGLHMQAPFKFDSIDYPEGKGYEKGAVYSMTKTANVLFSTEIARLTGAKKVPITSYSLTPGLIKTALAEEMRLDEWVAMGMKDESGEWTAAAQPILQTIPEGAATYVVAAFDPALTQKSGAYLQNCNVVDAAPHATDVEIAQKLWKLSEDSVKEKFVI